jgi:hypothetical protein
MPGKPLYVVSDEDLIEFKIFLRVIESMEPPNPAWLKEQRKKPKSNNKNWSLERLQQEHDAFMLRTLGRALSDFKGENGLNLPEGWQNDFAFNLEIVGRQLEDLMSLGTWPAPGYAKRIGVLLRRAKQKDLDARFGVVWSRLTGH